MLNSYFTKFFVGVALITSVSSMARATEDVAQVIEENQSPVAAYLDLRSDIARAARELIQLKSEYSTLQDVVYKVKYGESAIAPQSYNDRSNREEQLSNIVVLAIGKRQSDLAADIEDQEKYIAGLVEQEQKSGRELRKIGQEPDTVDISESMYHDATGEFSEAVKQQIKIRNSAIHQVAKSANSRRGIRAASEFLFYLAKQIKGQDGADVYALAKNLKATDSQAGDLLSEGLETTISAKAGLQTLSARLEQSTYHCVFENKKDEKKVEFDFKSTDKKVCFFDTGAKEAELDVSKSVACIGFSYFGKTTRTYAKSVYASVSRVETQAYSWDTEKKYKHSEAVGGISNYNQYGTDEISAASVEDKLQVSCKLVLPESEPTDSKASE